MKNTEFVEHRNGKSDLSLVGTPVVIDRTQLIFDLWKPLEKYMHRLISSMVSLFTLQFEHRNLVMAILSTSHRRKIIQAHTFNHESSSRGSTSRYFQHRGYAIHVHLNNLGDEQNDVYSSYMQWCYKEIRFSHDNIMY